MTPNTYCCFTAGIGVEFCEVVDITRGQALHKISLKQQSCEIHHLNYCLKMFSVISSITLQGAFSNLSLCLRALRNFTNILSSTYHFRLHQ